MNGKVLPPGVTMAPLPSPAAEVAHTRPLAKAARSGQRGGRQRHPGRFDTLNGFVDARMGSLSRGAALVWLCLWRDTKPNGLARTGVEDLAGRIGGNRSTVLRALRVLVDEGLVEVVRKGGIGRGPSVYRVK